MPVICIDPGHGGSDSGAVTDQGRTEKETNLRCALMLRPMLEARGFQVQMTRTGDTWLSLADRCKIANDGNADVLVSIHADGSFKDGKRDPVAQGHHTIHSVHDVPQGAGFILARAIVEKITENTGRVPFVMRGYVPTSPGTWARWNSSGTTDFYGMIRLADMTSVIIERGFMTNPTDAGLLFDNAHLQLQARGIADAITGIYGQQLTPILGRPQATVHQAKQWAKDRNAHQRFIDIADEYWWQGPLLGIRPEVAYAQSAKETAFGRYGGAVHPDQNNWAGIKTATATGDQPEDHETFASPAEGVRAHYNHLCAYVGKNPVGDPHGRYYLVTRLSWAGTIRHVEELGGRWAPNPDYGNSIIRDYLTPLLKTEALEAPETPETPGYDQYVSRDEFEQLVARVAAMEQTFEQMAKILRGD